MDRENLNALFDLAEQDKSVLLAQNLQGKKAIAFGYLPEAWADREQQLEQELDALQKKAFSTKDAATKAEV